MNTLPNINILRHPR